MMRTRFSSVAAMACAVAISACDKPAPKEPEPAPTPEATPTPAPTPVPTPTPEPIDKTAQVSILGYHRFESRERDPLAITPEHFRKQLQAVKDSGIPVIPMADFLAWRRGEKNIPSKAIVLTIDDGYDDTFTQAWPILKEFGFPFTFYVYTDYVGAGGRSIHWDELKEMAAAGVGIGSHTVSHGNLVRPKASLLKGKSYEEWLKNELAGSKALIEEKLGVEVGTLAYPGGNFNDVVMQAAKDAGYEASFTVSGQKARFESDPMKIGRYVVQSDKEFTFANALKFGGAGSSEPAAGGPPAVAGNPASEAMHSRPAQGEAISDPRPEIRIDLSSLGNVDPKTVEMRISGFGLVPANYDPSSKLLSYKMHQRIREPAVAVLVTARAGGKKVNTNWSFRYDPAAAPAPTATPFPDSGSGEPVPADDEADIPPMKPAE